MRLKLYRGPTVAEAMRQVRAELGPDALILGTRTVRGVVELTAALEPGPVVPPTPAEPPLAPPRAPTAATPGTALTAFHGLTGVLGQRLADPALEPALARVFRFAPLAFRPMPLMFAGPPGAGKTCTVARLATRLVLAGAKPMVITTDGQRAGAAEQLAAYTRLLKLDLMAATQPLSLAHALSRRPDGAPVLIDMAGTDCREPGGRDEVAALATAANAQLVLVLPAGLDETEATEIAASFAEAGADRAVVTRLDATRRLGSLLHAVHAAGLALAEAGLSPHPANGLQPMTASLLASRLRRPLTPHATEPPRPSAAADGNRR